MAFLPPTPINDIDGALAILSRAMPVSGHHDVDDLLSKNVSSAEVARVWKSTIDLDADRTRGHSANRNLTLAALLAAFEKLRITRYRELQSALATVLTKAGRPMTALGTRCELASRVAEGIYSEVRRTPGQPGAADLLRLVEQCLNAVLTDCKQREIPSYARRWHGIRGATRLMMAVQSPSASTTDQLDRYRAAADDLETAFRLGNRGQSAAAYLLDCLFHIVELDNSQASYDRFESAVAVLNDDERKSRTVLCQLGRYAFLRSFQEVEPCSRLNEAIAHLTAALTFPQELSTDDAFVRLIRGQALIRASIAHRDVDAANSLHALSAGIEDLKFTIESSGSTHHQVSLQPALVTRAKHFLRERRYTDARSDLGYLLANSRLRESDINSALDAEFLNLLVTLREAVDIDDQNTLATALDAALSHPLSTSHGLIAIALAAKHLYFEKTASYDPGLLRRTLSALETADLNSVENLESRRMHLSLKGRLSLMYGLVWQSEALELAVRASREAVECGSSTTDPELLALHGESLLQFAKYNLHSNGDVDISVDALEQAGDYLRAAAQAGAESQAAVSQWFKADVTYSKAGESYHRLFAITGALEHARHAVDSFEKSLQLGNGSAALLGLLGDAYYRVFRLTKDPAMLGLAISKKQASREAGHTSRENLSLSAKLSFITWEATGTLTDLSESIGLCARAHELSPSWPWPPFQLAEIIEDIDDVTVDAALDALGPISFSLIELLRRGRSALVEFGCGLVVRDEEFVKKSLGGRQPVYVLEDPHRLLSASYVFKHTSEANARRDRGIIQEFAEFSRKERITGLGLPTPVAVVPLDTDNVVYVMRRAPGIDLGRLVMRKIEDGASAPVAEYERALTYLAAFHAWGASIRRSEPIRALQFLTRQITDLLGTAQFSMPASSRQELMALGEVPQVLKKDAHPENWLVDERRRIWMLDFESSKVLPLPFEVVQLIDDYPLLPVTIEGWSKRMALCKHYMTTQERLSGKPSIDQTSAELLYAYCLILRATFGSFQSARRLRLKPASSAQRASSARLSHHRDVLLWLATSHPSEGVKALSSTVRKFTT